MDVLVVAEIGEGKVKKGTYSAVAAARGVTKALGGSYAILAMGAGIADAVKELRAFGASKVLAADDASLAHPLAEALSPTIGQAAKAGGYGLVLGAASAVGKDTLPRVAARLGAGYAPDVSDVLVSGGKLAFRRPMFAGNVLGTIEVTTTVAVASVRQSEFEPAAPAGGESPVETVAAAPIEVQGAKFLRLEATKSERPELTDARVVVSGGRGLKNGENFKTVLEPLVDALGAAMGASRAACDAGFVPNDLQVGQTGKVVAPELYVAVGISGAIQHLAGMKGSKVIVAINKDPDAPIFQVADYGLVADLFTAVPEMVAAVKKLQAEG
jgi:electron transfer flavoprotein alpha subunit